MKLHNSTEIPVKIQDIVFSLHAFLLTIIIIIQIAIYEVIQFF